MAMSPMLMSLFGRSSTPDAAPVVAAPVVAAGQAASAAGNPTVPSAATPASTGSLPAIPAAGEGQQSPVADFSKLWEADPNQKQTTQQFSPAFNMDPAKLQEAAQKLDFTRQIPEELLTKAMAGDVAAFREAINQAARIGFSTNASAASEIVKQSFANAGTTLNEHVLPNAIRQADIQRTLQKDNPIFSDPTAAPMLSMLQNQLASKYPTASAEEISGMAKTYMTELSMKVVQGQGGQVVTPDPRQQSYGQSPPTDWGKFFGTE